MSQKTDYEYFKRNLSNLYDTYGHQFLVIRDEQVLGAYPSFDDAYRAVQQTEPLGTFIIQECVKNPDDLVQTLYANIELVDA